MLRCTGCWVMKRKGGREGKGEVREGFLGEVMSERVK
jgi:hypothetical protein